MSDPYVTINSPDTPPLEIESTEALLEFLGEQMKQFQWLVEADVDLHNHLYSLISNVQSYAASGRAQDYLNQVFLSHRFPINGSAFALYIEDIRVENVALAILIISLLTRRIGLDFSNWMHVRALGVLFAFEQKVTAKSVEASQAGFARAVTSFQRQEASARGRSTAYENRLQTAEERYARVLALAKRYVSHKINIQRRIDDQRVKNSLSDMEATKALYMEHMALKAPVEYWKKKATEHKTGAKAMRKFLLGYAVCGTVLLLAGLYFLFSRSIEVVTAGAPVSVLFILATMGLVVTTIAFWGGRILTRLYLSEEHLKIDAGERATMVETYLALTSVNQASKDDRAIILASLFRPTADGIVKDDAAPDFSPAGIISRIATPG